MKILLDKWFFQRVNVSIVWYDTRMIHIHTNYSNIRKHNQLWWHKGQRFECILRIGRLQFTYTDYSLGGEINGKAEETGQAKRQSLVG